LTLTVFLSFYYRENGDEDSVILGTIVYMPYIILLTIINFALVVIGQQYLFRQRFKYLTALLTTIILTIIFLATAGHFKIHYWTLSITEFIILNLILFFFNFVGLFIWTQRKLT
jgi:hypothetical protein